MQDGQEAPPRPKSDEIKVDCFPEWTAHVKSFDGFPSNARSALTAARL